VRLWWRAVTETVADLHYQRRGFVRSLIRVVAAAPAAWLHGMRESLPDGRDVRVVMRRLRRSPGYALFSALTLAIAIGSTTAVSSVIEAALYRQQPIPQLDQIVNIYQKSLFEMPPSLRSLALSAHDLADLRARQTVFSSIAAWTRFTAPIVSGAAIESVSGEAVSADYFSLLGVTPALGRLLVPADQEPGARPVVVLGDGFWRRVFGGDPAVIGTTLRIRDEVFEIVGVAPPWFLGCNMPNLMPTPAWVPLPFGNAARDSAVEAAERRTLWVKARLKPGASLEDARSEVRLISQQIALADPERRSAGDRPGQPARGWQVMRMSDLRMHESVHMLAGVIVGVLSVMTALVLLVACSNLANLAMARAVRRRRDLAVSLALGASRIRLAREALLETAIIAAIGWGAGLAFAAAAIRIFAAPVQLQGAIAISLRLSPQLNVPVLLTSLAVTGLAVFAVGLIPSFRQTRLDIREAVAAESAASSPRWRARGALITLQVAVSVVFLALSFMAVRSLGSSLAHDPGFALDRLAQVSLDFTSSSDSPANRTARASIAADAIARVPGVADVALATGLPVGAARNSVVTVSAADSDDATSRVPSRRIAASGAVFHTLGVRRVSGQEWRPSDAAPQGGQVFVSESLATHLYPGGAIGKPVWIQTGYADVSQSRRAATISGIVRDTDTDLFGDTVRPFIVYEALATADEPAFSIVVRTDGARPSTLLPAIRAAALTADATLPIAAISTGMDVGGPAVLALQVIGGVVGSLGGFALFMAITGLFGVLTDLVSRRTHEIGVRMALGAGRRTIRRMVIVDGLRPVFAGLVIGGAVSWWMLRAAPVLRFMWRITPDVAVPLLGSTALLASAAVLACYLPAARASRVDPNVALRDL
jgi:predicted permease